MKTSTKLILTLAAIGTLGLGGLAKLVNAAHRAQCNGAARQGKYNAAMAGTGA